MIPIGDENPTIRRPVMTWALLAILLVVWVVVQGAGSGYPLIASVCNLGLVPGELTRQARLGFELPMAPGVVCVVDADPINFATPVTSMFLHGSWGHLLTNGLYFWVFGNNVEDSMGRMRFLVFYLLCGLAAAAVHVLVDPASPVPTVGASGAISGIMGAYLLLYPHARVRMLFFIVVISFPAWAVLLWWFASQVLTGLPQLSPARPDISGGVAVWAHVGGFVAGVALIRLFRRADFVLRRTTLGDARVAFEQR